MMRRRGLDLRREGSGNIGALNAFEVSRSRSIGIAVLGLDLLKGALPVLVVQWVLHGDYVLAVTALLGTVIGHNYSPWIGFKGGRGLASAAGGTLVFDASFLIFWVGVWLLSRIFSRNVHVGNIAATVLAPFGVLLLPAFSDYFSTYAGVAPAVRSIAAFTLCCVIFLRHIAPLRVLLRSSA
ncbi:MAG: glycerol-3-phosphate acyltransferase [Ignavibacteriae bacterium]|nr:glycerol-3-phosphate acyltransferase [Ignavibacteriota bacterium]